MDALLSSFVEQADNIRTSGRWAAVNARIGQLTTNPDPHEAWRVQVLGSLCAGIFASPM
jgi:hypothetical protein